VTTIRRIGIDASSRAGVRAPRRNVVLRLGVLALTILPLWSLLTEPSEIPAETRAAAGVMWVLCLAPAWIYLQQPPSVRRPIPFLPLIGLLFGLYFPLSVVMGRSNVYNVFDPTTQFTPLSPELDYTLPTELALLGWIALLVGYLVGGVVTPRRRPSTLSRIVWNVRALRQAATVMMIGGVAFDLLQQAIQVPLVLRGMLSFVGLLSRFGAAVLIVLSIRGELSRSHRLLLYAALLAFSYIQIGHGSVGNFALVVLVVFLAVWIGGGRLGPGWLALAVASAVLFVAMRGVALDFRRSAWFGMESLPVGERGRLMLELVARRTENEGLGVISHGWSVVASRSADMDLFADVVRRTPSEVPHWGGATYLSLVGMAVPRVLWPNKPQKTLGGQFGHRYGYLFPTDHSTSINLPFLIEFYVNFGAGAVGVGMFVVGIIFRLLSAYLNRPGQGTMMSLVGLVMLLPLVNVDGDFSLVFGGLLLNGAALWVVLRVLQRVAGRRAAGADQPERLVTAPPLLARALGPGL
jgi:hypothetical protein